MGERPSPYNELLQIVAESQEEKGEGGGDQKTFELLSQ